MGAPRAIPPLFKPGSVVADKYEIQSVIGEGGMGIVLAAKHLKLGHRVALKLLHPHRLKDAEAKTRFLREARAVVALSSDHVARVLDVGESDDGVPFLVMELLVGETLASYVSRSVIRPDEAVAFGLAICDALAEAHALGITHRDLKPENVFLVEKRNGERIAKVLDFGVSKVENEEILGNVGSLTASGSYLGTPAYMSPEQLSAQVVGPKADVWSLAATLYFALTRRLPYEAKTFYELSVKVHAEDPVPIRRRRREIPERLANVIDGCLRKEASRRSTIADLMQALRTIRPDELVEAETIDASTAEAPAYFGPRPTMTAPELPNPPSSSRNIELAAATRREGALRFDDSDEATTEIPARFITGSGPRPPATAVGASIPPAAPSTPPPTRAPDLGLLDSAAYAPMTTTTRRRAARKRWSVGVVAFLSVAILGSLGVKTILGQRDARTSDGSPREIPTAELGDGVVKPANEGTEGVTEPNGAGTAGTLPATSARPEESVAAASSTAVVSPASSQAKGGSSSSRKVRGAGKPKGDGSSTKGGDDGEGTGALTHSR